eukprot:g23198.t1
MLFLLPAYKQKLKREDPSRKAYNAGLWDCMELVGWTIFKCSAENRDKYGTTVMDFISKSVEYYVPKKSIQVFSNRKPWMNQEIHSLLKTRRAAFKL